VGQKSQGGTFLNTVLDVCSNRGAKHETGAQTLTSPPAGDGPAYADLSEYVFIVKV